jgi:DNA-binding Lrp family transcriptional regulator
MDEHDRRILAHMQRAPSGHYTTAQLARNTGVTQDEVERRLTQLEQEGYVVRSDATTHPAFQLTEQGSKAPVRRRAV